MSENGTVSEQGEQKARVYIPTEEFIPIYKQALADNVKLVDFANQVGMAPQSIVQKVMSINRLNKGYAEHYKKMGMEVPILKVLSQATGATKGRKKLSVADMLRAFGMKTDEPV